MQIDPAQHTHADNYKLLTNPVVPRPIAWFTSQNANGVINLAPFSFFNEVSGNPLYLIISIGLNDAGEAKDTAKNIMASGEFVVNLVTGELSDAMNIPAADFPGVQVAQFAIAGQQYAGDRRGGDVPCGRSCRTTGRFDVARISYVEWKKGRTGSISKTNSSGGSDGGI
jgi:flavin reductase (DIM6/NTAB) family NADH-FMN oxidoreductase RutF